MHHWLHTDLFWAGERIDHFEQTVISCMRIMYSSFHVFLLSVLFFLLFLLCPLHQSTILSLLQSIHGSSQHTLPPLGPKSTTLSSYTITALTTCALPHALPPFPLLSPPPLQPHPSSPPAGTLPVFGPVVKSAASTSCGHWWLHTCSSSSHFLFWSFSLTIPTHATVAPITHPRQALAPRKGCPCPARAPPTLSVSPFLSVSEEAVSFLKKKHQLTIGVTLCVRNKCN